jgi:hypothetical protein
MAELEGKISLQTVAVQVNNLQVNEAPEPDLSISTSHELDWLGYLTAKLQGIDSEQQPSCDLADIQFEEYSTLVLGILDDFPEARQGFV